MAQRGHSGKQGEHKYLGELQAEIMDVVWERGSVTVRDVVDALAPRRDLAYTTVMTVMTRLWEQGTLVRERVGKTYAYRATHTREGFRAAISGAVVRDLVADFGDVALAQFAAALEQADPARLARLRALVNLQEHPQDDA